MKRHNRGKYRSGLEDRIAKSLSSLGIPFTYEEEKIKYDVPAKTSTYTPDFVITSSSGKKIYIETKGIWDAEDRKKHLLIRQQHPELDIRFVFSNSKAKIRKGSSITYADVCEGKARAPYKGVTWLYSDKTIPEEWLRE